MPGYDPRLGTLDEQPFGWAGIANSRVSELYDTDSQFSDYGMITLDRDVGGSNSTGFFRLWPTRNDTSRGWLQVHRVFLGLGFNAGTRTRQHLYHEGSKRKAS